MGEADAPEYRIRSLDGSFEAQVPERELTYTTGPANPRQIRTSVHWANEEEGSMAKEQKRGNREAKKPKQDKPKVIAAAPRRLGQLSTDPKSK
jgi:hypothetical protein